MCFGERPEAIILIGVETHVCVENTAIDLRQNGYEVHTVADCCSSRFQEDRLLALEVICFFSQINIFCKNYHNKLRIDFFFLQRMRDIGCHIATSEHVILKLLRSADHEKFKEILKYVKLGTLYTGLVPVPKI